VMCVIAASASDKSMFAERLFSVSEKAFIMTAGTFVGLLGGRAAAPDPIADSASAQRKSPARRQRK
jgi:hypothetical protein